MNKTRREEIKIAYNLIANAKSMLEDAKGIIDGSKEDEEEYKDNMPENMTGGEKYSQAERDIDYLENASSKLQEALDTCDEATSELDNIGA